VIQCVLNALLQGCLRKQTITVGLCTQQVYSEYTTKKNKGLLHKLVGSLRSKQGVHHSLQKAGELQSKVKLNKYSFIFEE
jgi:hypothetical protein